MRKRMMAFLMALLMVVTILPANFTIVEANDTNGAIYLKVTGASDWTQADNIKVTVTDSTGKEVEQKFVRTEVVKAQTDSGNTNPDNTNPDNTDSGNNNPGNTDTGKDDAAGKDTENTGSESGSDNSNEPAGQADEQQDAKLVAFNSIKIDVTGLLKDSKYSVDISSDEYLSWKKECTAVEASDSPVYTEVAMVKDTYKEFAFSTDFNGWKLDTTPILAVKGADNNSVIKYASSDQEIADVDETTDVVNIKKAGKVSFTATLSVGDSYKTITQSDVAIAKLDQTLSFTDAKTEVYVGDEVATAASSSANDAKGKITYSVVNGEEYITKDTDFANNGKWTAKSYNNSADETVVSLKDDEKDETFRIDTTKPEINVEYASEKAAYSVVDSAEYYNTERTAKVSVKENSVFFNQKLVNIWVSEDGGKEVDINNSDKLPDGIVKDSDWTLGAGKDAVSTLTIKFTNDHKYTIRVEAQDLAENKADGYKINKSNTFVIDKINPTGNMKYNYLSQGTDTTWTSFADWKNILNGGKYEISRFSKGKMYVSGSVRDEFSGVKEVSYNVSNKDGVFADVSGVTSWTPMKSTGKDGSYAISLPENDMNYVVYLKIVDYSGNVSYVSTNGAVLDTQAPKVNVTLPTDINGIYASNVNVGVSVSDNAATGVVSGIRSVSYKVTSMGQQTQTGDLYTYTATAGSLDDLTKSVSRNFTVDAGLNNSNDVQIEVTAVDNAGNTYKTTNVIKIDITAPTIEVSYDNNSGDTTFGDDTYFKESRTATVKVTERNFDPAKVIPVIEASAGGVPSISGWTTVSGSGNGDDTVNIATIYYGNDADYTFNISAEDIVGNKSGDVNYGNSLAPTKFTVDKTVPVISVAYDNNNAAEAGFYKEQRTATVTIQEHNFETSRVVLTMNATDNGNPASAPTISGWSGSGDTHTATISFASDAVYTWTLAYTDKAGNKATDLENQSFCVDLTKPAITISGINPNSANNTDGNIGFAIECTDTNFGTFTPVLTAVVYENGSFATKEIEGSASSVGNGERIEYGNLEEDGMYSLRCAAVDKAGNAYDTVNIVDEDGVSSTVNLQDGDNLIDFSVNRNGSTFALNDYSMDVVNDYYVQETAEDIVFYETNADELLNYNIKLNGNALKEGNDYKVTESGGDGSWYRYEYAVNKSLFDDEGEYNLVVESEDKATSMAYSDLKNVSADFVIDKTAPTFTISGIEEDGNYRGTSQNVTLVPTDDGGKLGHVKVTILDKDGKEQKVISDMSGDELTKYLNGNDGKIKFKVPEGVNQQVAILCADCSIGTDGGTNTTDFIYKGITVSSNAFILFFENKPLFYGVLGVVAAAIIVPTGFVIYKKKRKTKKEASEQ